MIKQSIESFVSAQWVSCDITDLKVNGTGHCYLEITEKSEGRGSIPKAKATAIIWRNSFQMIDAYFYKETGERLRSGIKVLLFVEVNYHELYGLSLVVRNIDPTYTLGDGERLKRETIAQLTSDGVLDMNKGLELPVVIDRVAVISSLTAAGYDDFMNHLRTNSYGYVFHVELFPAIVQGDGAEESIITALMGIAEKCDDFDTVVIIRGGGSQSDMSCFNSYMLCSYIAQFPIPLLTGIGHNKDVSVADMVAHTSLKTPTAVANFLVDTKRAFEDRLEQLKLSLVGSLNHYRERENARIDGLIHRLHIAVSSGINSQKMLLERLLSQIKYNAKGRYVDEENRIKLYEKELLSSNPDRILKMGYSIVVHNGQVIRSINDLSSKDIIDIMVNDGTVKAVVE